MKRDKIEALFLVSVLALSGIGIAYAGWTDTIFVSGTVQTGYVGYEVTEYTGTWVWKHYADEDGNQLHETVVHFGPVADSDINGDGIYNDDSHPDAAIYYDHPEE